MGYGVLTQEDNFLHLAPREITIGHLGLNEILIKISDAVRWLEKNPEKKLIITMPLDPIQRYDIEKKLGKYDERCIALDPAILLDSTRPIFRDTQTLKIGILGQIKDIIEREDISA